MYRKADGLASYFGSISVDQINAGSIRSYLTALDEARSKPLAPSTKIKNLAILKQVLELALDDDLSLLEASFQVTTRDLGMRGNVSGLVPFSAEFIGTQLLMQNGRIRLHGLPDIDDWGQ